MLTKFILTVAALVVLAASQAQADSTSIAIGLHPSFDHASCSDYEKHAIETILRASLTLSGHADIGSSSKWQLSQFDGHPRPAVVQTSSGTAIPKQSVVPVPGKASIETDDEPIVIVEDSASTDVASHSISSADTPPEDDEGDEPIEDSGDANMAHPMLNENSEDLVVIGPPTSSEDTPDDKGYHPGNSLKVSISANATSRSEEVTTPVFNNSPVRVSKAIDHNADSFNPFGDGSASSSSDDSSDDRGERALRKGSIGGGCFDCDALCLPLMGFYGDSIGTQAQYCFCCPCCDSLNRRQLASTTSSDRFLRGNGVGGRKLTNAIGAIKESIANMIEETPGLDCVSVQDIQVVIELAA